MCGWCGSSWFMDYSSWQEGSADVRMCGYADMRMCRCADVQMWGCADGAGVHGSWFIVHGRREVQMCGCADMRIWGSSVDGSRVHDRRE